MAQGEYIELHRRRNGRRLDHDERQRKKEARGNHLNSKIAKKVRGLKAKQYNKKLLEWRSRVVLAAEAEEVWRKRYSQA